MEKRIRLYSSQYLVGITNLYIITVRLINPNIYSLVQYNCMIKTAFLPYLNFDPQSVDEFAPEGEKFFSV